MIYCNFHSIQLIGQLFMKTTAILPSDAIFNSCATNKTKLRSFQIRLNLSSIVTNVQFYGIDISSNVLCMLCLEESETLTHLFYICKIVDAFWNDISDWIVARFRINIPSNNFHKLFGFLAQYFSYQLVNLMLLSTKFLIYRCKYSKTKPKTLQYFYTIKSTKNKTLQS